MLVQHIQARSLVEMAELAIDHLRGPLQEDGSRVKGSRRRTLTSVLEWVQCFANYTSVIAQSHPTQISDMMGYLYLILEAHMEFEGENWLGYDHRFRKASTPGESWAKIDSTLSNMSFPDTKCRAHCIYCFGVTHCSVDYSHAPDCPSTDKGLEINYPSETPRPCCHKVCKEWNFTHGVLCSYPGCRFDHINYAGTAPKT